MKGFSLSVAALAFGLVLTLSGAASARGGFGWAPIPHGPSPHGIAFVKPPHHHHDGQRTEIGLGAPVAYTAPVEAPPPPPPPEVQGSLDEPPPAAARAGERWDGQAPLGHGPLIIYIGADIRDPPPGAGPRIVYGDDPAEPARRGPKVIYGDFPR